MTTATAEQKTWDRREYDIQRRPGYAARAAELRKKRGWEKEKEARARRLTDPIVWAKYAISRIKHRAKKKNMEFDLTYEDLILPKECPVLGIPIIVSLGYEARVKHECPSIDRLDSKRGYTKDNIRVISDRANRIKRDSTIKELEAVLKYMRENLPLQQ